LLEPQEAQAPPSVDLGDDAGDVRAEVDLGDSFAIDGLVPSHGPWNGGTRAVVSGRGFSSKLRVFVGGVELDPSAIFASEPTRAAIVVPAGNPGPADVTIRDDATAKQRTLKAGFFYDAFVVEPNSGATSGGTRVTLRGKGTAWTSGVKVAIAGVTCGDLQVDDATDLKCTTPPAPGGAGTKDVTVTAPDGTILQARDAYSYSDSPDGYRGGLSGGALSGSVRVLVFDAWTGTTIVGARAFAGTATGITDGTGVAAIALPPALQTVTVTVAAKCHQPMTFVAVPVDTVTAYLTPVLDLSCVQGDPSSVGNFAVTNGGGIQGELVFPGGIEQNRGPWPTVPQPSATRLAPDGGPAERRVAYVFTATGSPLDTFNLPDPKNAVTEDSPGSVGYTYTLGAAPGNRTVYALAGIEDRTVSPPRFVAYAMGAQRGVSVQPSEIVTGVNIPMTTLLDHEVAFTPEPPATTPRGPDRLVAQLAVSLGESGYAILPAGLQVSFLPLSGTVDFIGVPALDGTLAGEAYVVGAQAVTGDGWGVPASVVSRVRTTDANQTLTLGGFLPIPVLNEPTTAPWGGTHVSLSASGAYDLVLLTIGSGNGLVTWTIVAPKGATDFYLPDLSSLPGGMGLRRGALDVGFSIARIDQFAYGGLRMGQLSTGAWNAYAMDSFSSAY
jgi:hypothetical protein